MPLPGEGVIADPGEVAARLAESVDALPDGTGYAEQVHRLLAVVRAQLGMDVAWVSEFVGAQQVLRYVDAAPDVAAPAAGSALPLGGSFCARVLDGRFPDVIPDARQSPDTALLDVTAELHIGAYVGVPLVGPQGVTVGMLCAISDRAAPALGERDAAALRLLAQLLHDLQSRALSAEHSAAVRSSLRRAVQTVVDGAGRHPVLQPVVELSAARAVAAEGLTRFSSPVAGWTDGDSSGTAPAQWFAAAAQVGLRTELELAAAASVLDLLETTHLPPHVAVCVNLHPETLLDPRVEGLLTGRELRRIVVEVTEHAPVSDYERLAAALGPLRDQGLRLAVDDAGAGYSSLRHVLTLRPDLVKVDMALTRGIDADPARRTLVRALTTFAADVGCRIVAEGVETHAELRALRECGVELAQGYLLAEPSTSPRWAGYPTA